MTIEKIEDVIIPQKVIGVDTGWEEEILPIIKAYADFLGDDMSLPTPIGDINNCEKVLETILPNDLKLFYLKFGAAKLGEGLFNVNEFQYISSSWGQSMLNHYTDEEQNVLSKLIVFGDYLGNGNVWCFHKDTKEIFYYDHDCKPNINQMFQTFYQYLQSLLIFTQRNIGQDIQNFDKECEKLVVDLIGKDRVKVWQYFGGWD
jgi:SMI1-KNR4 cell-wall